MGDYYLFFDKFDGYFDWQEVGVISSASLTSPQTQYHYLRTDHLGTPQLATTKDGSTSWEATSEAFGAAGIIQSQLTIEMNLRFPGLYCDEETNSHYNFHRDYKPNQGRYVQSDPIGLEAGVNVFGYSFSNPVIYIDFDGLKARMCCRRIPGLFGAHHCFIQVAPDDKDNCLGCNENVEKIFSLHGPGLMGSGKPGGGRVIEGGTFFDNPNFLNALTGQLTVAWRNAFKPLTMPIRLNLFMASGGETAIHMHITLQILAKLQIILMYGRLEKMNRPQNHGVMGHSGEMKIFKLFGIFSLCFLSIGLASCAAKPPIEKPVILGDGSWHEDRNMLGILSHLRLRVLPGKRSYLSVIKDFPASSYGYGFRSGKTKCKIKSKLNITLNFTNENDNTREMFNGSLLDLANSSYDMKNLGFFNHGGGDLIVDLKVDSDNFENFKKCDFHFYLGRY